MKEFKLNEFITLKLEEEQTNIYFKNNKEPFMQCKYILLNKNFEELKNIFEDIKSVDELKEKYNQELENIEPKLLNIPPEAIFWAHCSNLQVWVENNYNPDLLDSNLSFPLLKELMELGDFKAKRIFKEVVAKRFLEGPQSIREVFCNEGYFDTFSKEERRALFKYGIETIEKLELIIDEELKKEDIKMLPIVVSRLESVFNGIMWKEGNVVGLKLLHTNFKELPEIIRELKDLEFLSLGTELLESIPEWIAEFKSLKQLEIIFVLLDYYNSFLLPYFREENS